MNVNIFVRFPCTTHRPQFLFFFVFVLFTMSFDIFYNLSLQMCFSVALFSETVQKKYQVIKPCD